ERRIEGILAAAPGTLEDIAAAVREALAECRAAVALARRDEAEAERHARRLLALMADLLAAALLLGAAAATAAGGDYRKARGGRRVGAQGAAPATRPGHRAGRELGRAAFGGAGPRSAGGRQRPPVAAPFRRNCLDFPRRLDWPAFSSPPWRCEGGCAGSRPCR